MRQDLPHISIYRNQHNLSNVVFSSTQHYKLMFLAEPGTMYFANQCIKIDSPALAFIRPLQPCAWESSSPLEEDAMQLSTPCSYSCLLSAAMIEGNSTKRSWIKKVFANDSNPIIPIDDELAAMSGRIFEMLIQNGLRQSLNTEELDYVAASGIATIISLACSAQHVPIQPVSQALPTSNAAQRTTELFLLLLEEQFPVDYPNKALQLKSAADYANRLSVHVNHLNRVVKSVSGKTTSELIAVRICTEAIRMLQQSALSISEVAFALGFEEPVSSSAFIRRHTGSSPSSYRRTIV